MFLKIVFAILILQNCLLSVISLNTEHGFKLRERRHSTTENEKDVLGVDEAILDSVFQVLHSAKEKAKDAVDSGTRRFGLGNIVGSVFGETEDSQAITLRQAAATETTIDDIVHYLNDAYTKFYQIMNDKRTQDLMTIYKQNPIEFVNTVYNNKQAKALIDPLIGQAVKSVKAYAINSHIDSSPYLYPVKSLFGVIAPLTGGNNVFGSIVTKMYDLTSR